MAVSKISTAVQAPRTSQTQGPASAGKGDYVVKKGDTLSKLAKQLVEQRGGKATNAAVAKALAEIKAANPELCTAKRRGGDLIFPGDKVVLPEANGWKAGDASQTAPQKSAPAGGKEAAQVQMAAAAESLKAEAQAKAQALATQLDGFAQVLASKQSLTPNEQQMVSQFMGQLQQQLPELLESPSGQKALQELERLSGAGDPEVEQDVDREMADLDQPQSPAQSVGQTSPAATSATPALDEGD
jgi:hypothetical protein